MDSNHLTSQQLERIQAVVNWTLHYLNKLKKRMDARKFPLYDQLRLPVDKAYNGLHSLSVTLHYLVCDAHARERVAKENRDRERPR